MHAGDQSVGAAARGRFGFEGAMMSAIVYTGMLMMSL